MKIQKQFSSVYFLKHTLYLSFALTSLVAAKDVESKKDAVVASAVTELKTYADYKKMMSNAEPSIVMVKAKWCGACKGFKPTFEKVAEKYGKDAHFYFLDESNKELQKELASLGVQGFPTILYIKKDLGGAPETMFSNKVRDFLNLPVEATPAPAAKKEVKKETKAKKLEQKSATKELMTKKDYDAMLQSKKPVALLLHASWCGACSMFKPAFHEVADKRTDMVFYLLDVDNAELSKEIAAFNIEGIPTTVFFKKDGKKLTEHSKMVGARSADQFEAEIDKVISGKKASAKAEPAKKNNKKSKKNK